jgi:hypothetical protein
MNLDGTDGHQETFVKVRWYDKRPMLELCAKVVGLVNDQPSVNVEHLEVLVQRLDVWKAKNRFAKAQAQAIVSMLKRAILAFEAHPQLHHVVAALIARGADPTHSLLIEAARCSRR